MNKDDVREEDKYKKGDQSKDKDKNNHGYFGPS